MIELQNPNLPANAQDIDNIALTDSGEIKKLIILRKGLNGKRKNK